MRSMGQELWEWLAGQGVAGLGLAPAGAMADAPAGLRPSDLLPGAAGLVCLGLPVPRGIFQAGQRGLALYWRAANVLYRRLDALALDLANRLEARGGLALPVPGCFPYDYQGRGRFTGYLSLARLGQACGLGRLGHNGLLFHHRFGPRLLLAGVVTTLELAPGAWPGPATRGCPPECRICLEACPAGALSGPGLVDGPACTTASSKSPLFAHLLRAGAVRPGQEALLNQTTAVDDHSWYTCLECVAACPEP